jgi:hypothetical protein
MIGSTIGYCIGLYSYILTNGVLQRNGYDIIDPGWFLRILGVICLIVTFCIHCFKTEHHMHLQTTGCADVLRLLRNCWKNPNFLHLAVFFFGWRFAFAPVDNNMRFSLISKGMTKEHYTEMQAIIQPFLIVASIIAGKISKRERELQIMIWMVLLKYFENFLKLYLTSAYSQDNFQNSFLLLTASGIFNEVIITNLAVAKGVYLARICDLVASGTFITILNSTYTFGKLISDSISLVLLKEVEILHLAIGAWVLGGIFLAAMYNTLIKLQTSDKDSWKLGIHSELTVVSMVSPKTSSQGIPPNIEAGSGSKIDDKI